MPWKEQQLVEIRESFVRAFFSQRASMADLCREYGIARKTGYKWTQRFIDGGVPNLVGSTRLHG